MSLHDILVGWRDGSISAAEAMRIARIDDEDGLRQAAMLSGVLPMTPPTDEERAHQDRVDSILAAGLEAADPTDPRWLGVQAGDAPDDVLRHYGLRRESDLSPSELSEAERTREFWRAREAADPKA